MRLRRLGTTAAAFSALAVLLLPQAAYAAPMIDGSIYRPKVTTAYSIVTDRPAWSAIGVYSPYDWDLSLYEARGPWLDTSHNGAGRTEFVAINSYLRPLGPYTAEAHRFSGYYPYVQWRQATDKIVLPYPANDGVTGAGDPDLAFAWIMNRDVINVFNMYLQRGEAFWVNSTPHNLFYLLETRTTDGTTMDRGEAGYVPGMRVVGNCTLYRANVTGWHGVVMVSDRTPVTTVPAGGLGLALHRFDPARPDTCPQRNFPDYTPPGP